MKPWALLLAAIACAALLWWAAASAPGDDAAQLESTHRAENGASAVPENPTPVARETPAPTAIEVSAPHALTTQDPTQHTHSGPPVQAPAPRRVTLRVLDRHGAPVPGLSFSIRPPARDTATAPLSVTTDESGLARATRVAPEGVSTWHAKDPGFEFVSARTALDRAALSAMPPTVLHERSVRSDRLPAGRDVTLELVALRFDAGLVGRVLGADGGPRADVTLMLLRPTTPEELRDEPRAPESGDAAWRRLTRERTDDTGLFRFSDLPPGPVRLLGSYSDAPSETQVLHAALELEAGRQHDLGVLPLARDVTQRLRIQPRLDGVAAPVGEIWEQPQRSRWAVVLWGTGDWPGLGLAGSHPPDAPISVFNLPPSTWKAAVRGDFLVGDDPGRLRAGVAARWRAPQLELLTTPGPPCVLPIEFTRPVPVLFELVDETGLPDGAELEAAILLDDGARFGPIPARLTSGVGQMEFALAPDDYVVLVVERRLGGEHMLALQHVTVPRTDSLRVRVRLVGRTRVEGTLRASSGEPLVGVLIEALPRGTALHAELPRALPDAWTDIHGCFELEDLPAHARLELRAWHRSWGTHPLPGELRSGAADAVTRHDIVWDPPASRDGDG